MKEWLLVAVLVFGGWDLDRFWRVGVGATILAIWVVWLALKGELKWGGLVKDGGMVGLMVLLSGLWMGINREWGWWVGMWLSGWLMGVVSLNEGKKLNWRRVGMAAGLIFSLIALKRGSEQSSLSLIGWATEYHHHLADWWGVVLVGSGIEWWSWLGWLMGGYWLVRGLSRSAYAALVAGWGWRGGRGWGRWGLVIGLGAVLALSIWAGRKKALLAHRIYWEEGVRAIVARPQGWGWGKFSEVSQRYKVDWNSCGSCVSSYAHDFWLEMGVAGGWWALGWLIWWGWRMGKGLKRGAMGAMLVAALVNLTVDYTYLIPAMWWLFWGVLGRMGSDD